MVSRLPGGGGPFTNSNFDSSISHNGRWVEFGSSSEVPRVALRGRIADTTDAVSAGESVNGSISGNSCVVAYSDTGTNVGSGTIYGVFAFDRCNDTTTLAGAAFAPEGSSSPPFPVPNRDGSVIAWSTESAINYSTRSGSEYVQAEPITPAGLGDVGRRVAISDNGRLITFDAIGTETSQPNAGIRSVFLLDVQNPTAIEAIAADASGVPFGPAFGPSMSGNGSIVAYTFRSSDIATALLVRDRANGQDRAISAQARNPAVSRDGNYVAFELVGGEIADIYVARSTGPLPFESVEIDLVSYVDGDPTTNTGGSASDPAISAHGRWVSFDSFSPFLLVPAEPVFHQSSHVFVRQRRPAVTVEPIAYGTVTTAVDGTSTVTSNGLAGFQITSIEADGDYGVKAHNCPSVLQPGASCEVTVTFSPSAEGLRTGTLTVRDDSYPTDLLVGQGALTGTLEGVPVTTTTTTTLPPDLGLTIDPDPVEFGERLVGASGPTVEATVTNIGDVTVTVESVSIGGVDAADFSVVVDGCVDEALSPGASCELDLGFVASAAGARTASLAVAGSSATSASAVLQGSGRFDAVLEVSPLVAAGGQVVAILGSGYPASTAVQLTTDIGQSPIDVTTDADGGFIVQLLVLTATPHGPSPIDDVAVVGEYDAAPVEVLVVPSPVRPQATATLTRSSRAYVSR